MLFHIRLKWVFRSQQYRIELAEEACKVFDRGTFGYYIYGEILYALRENLILTVEDYTLMDAAQMYRDARKIIDKAGFGWYN